MPLDLAPALLPAPAAQLLRTHRTAPTAADGASSLASLTAAAERVARAGLRLDPTAAPLWAALGAVAAEVSGSAQRGCGLCSGGQHAWHAARVPCVDHTSAPCPPHAQPGVREYALCRALQLDPKCVPAWVALARLYAGEWAGSGWGWVAGKQWPCCWMSSLQAALALALLDEPCPPATGPAEHGAAGPASSALQHARSHEPAVPTIWEAMADVAALSPSGACAWPT